MKRIIFISFLIAFCGFNLFGQKITKDEYSIYALTLKNIYKENLENTKLKTSFVILDRTFQSDYFTDEPDAGKMKGLSKDFKKNNKVVVKLEKSFPTIYKYNLVGKNDIEKLLSIGEIEAEKIKKEYASRGLVATNLSDVVWKSYDQKYPNSLGYYKFSRIGFSFNKRFALVEILGEGAYWSSNTTYVLEKKNGRWKIYESSGSRGIA